MMPGQQLLHDSLSHMDAAPHKPERLGQFVHSLQLPGGSRQKPAPARCLSQCVTHVCCTVLQPHSSGVKAHRERHLQLVGSRHCRGHAGTEAFSSWRHQVHAAIQRQEGCISRVGRIALHVAPAVLHQQQSERQKVLPVFAAFNLVQASGRTFAPCKTATGT